MKTNEPGQQCAVCASDDWYDRGDGFWECRPCRNSRSKLQYHSLNAAEKAAKLQENVRWSGENLARRLVYRAKDRARKLGVAFDLDANDLVIPEVCPVLGIPLQKGRGHTRAGSPSLDRFDPKGGYTKDNVRVISHRANTIKTDANAAELALVLKYVQAGDAGTVDGKE